MCTHDPRKPKAKAGPAVFWTNPLWSAMPCEDSAAERCESQEEGCSLESDMAAYQEAAALANRATSVGAAAAAAAALWAHPFSSEDMEVALQEALCGWAECSWLGSAPSSAGEEAFLVSA